MGVAEWTYTLVELPVSAKCHSRLVASVHSVDVVAFDLPDLVHSYIASKGDLGGWREGGRREEGGRGGKRRRRG